MKVYIVLTQEREESENMLITIYRSFESLRADNRLYDKNIDVLIFITEMQDFAKLDGLDNLEPDTTMIILTTLFEDPVRFESIINDEYDLLQNQLTTLTAENNLLKSQLFECQERAE